MPSPKRLLLVFDLSFPFVKGGAQRRFYEVARVLASRGWEVDWLTFTAWEGGEHVVRDGIRYVGLGPAPDLYGEDGKRNGREPLVFAWRVIKALPRLKHYDVIWLGQWPLLHVLPVLATASIFGKPAVLDWWEVWGFELWTRYNKALGLVGFCIEKLTLGLFARQHTLVTDTKVEQDRMRALAGPAVRIHRITNGVPRDAIGDVSLDEDRPIDIVSLGRLKDHKRVDLLLEALIRLKEQYGEEPHVDIIGDGPERTALETMAREGGLRNVTFHGFVEDLHEVYERAKKAKLCAVTTQAGGAGNLTLLEAYGCGLPVVAFRIDEGIDPDLIQTGETGLLISPPTSEALAAGLRGLLADPAQIGRMRRNAYERSKGLDWESVAGDYEGVFTSLVR